MSRFTLIVTAILGIGYAYVASRLGAGLFDRLALAVPFLLVCIVPMYYWGRDRDDQNRFDELVHVASYLSMAWLSFLVVATLARDALLAATALLPAAEAHAFLQAHGTPLVYLASVLALVIGALTALRGPRLATIDVP